MQELNVYTFNYAIILSMKEEEPKRRGRPVGYRTANPANKMLPVKVTEDQLTTYKEAAESSGKTFSGWVRSVLDRESSYE